MILQIAFDAISSISEELVRPYADDPIVRFEFGTPVVNEFGYASLSRLFPFVPHHRAYIDVKTVDFHLHELNRLRHHGFRHCSFLLGSEIKALKTVTNSPFFADFEIWISTMGVPLRELHREADEVIQLGYKHFIAHGHGLSLPDAFNDMMERFQILQSLSGTKIILAGGISIEHMAEVNRLNPYAIIVGRSITNAPSPAGELKSFRDAIPHE